MRSVSVIVPAYLQQDNIASDLEEIYKVLNKLPRYSVELICVVDGGADKTLQNALKFAKHKANVKILHYKKNRGKGFAVHYGMKHSKGQVVGFIDSGGDIRPYSLPYFLHMFEKRNADIVIGSKRHPLSKVNYPWQRRILSYYYQMLVKILFDLDVKDTQVGMKFYKREVISTVLPLVVTKKYAFDIEILALAHHFGYTTIFEAPAEVTLDFGGKSVITGGKLISVLLEMLKDTFAIFIRLKVLKMYTK